jgi:two-component system, NarL family, invasion response regulator UvrY
MIRVMIVDDHAMLREGLRSKLEASEGIEVVAEAGTARELMSRLAEARPDVLLLDIKLPDGSGIMLIPQVKQARSQCKVIILTMYNHPRYAMHALESGADGFVVKGAPFEELLQGIRKVAGGERYVSSAMAAELAARVARPRKGTLESLSQREFQVLVEMGNGYSVKEIAYRLGVSEKSVTTYRTRVMEKLKLANKADLIKFALENNLTE